jgi:glycosyltransferase involved in cell wall biosynthesis
MDGPMLISIITPTLLRPSLLKTCEMIDAQTHTEWQHVVMIDCENVDEDLIEQILHPQRMFIKCLAPHGNGGNSCRHNAWEMARGNYVMYCDDDNYYADEGVLAGVAASLQGAGYPAWALFPINRLGWRFYFDPPRSCHVDTMNVVLRHDYAQWPDTTAYGSDGILVDSLMKRQIPYAAFPDFRPIGVIPQLSFCK